MIYLVTALDAEARTLVDHYRLKRDTTLPFTLYRNEAMFLLVSQPGKMQTMMALSALLGYAIPGDDDILINVGICGAPDRFSIGEALLIHQIIDERRNYYPDILYPHPWNESELLCLDAPQDGAVEHPVDMESAAVFLAASKFFKLHRIAFLKIVSDHFTPETVTKEGVVSLMQRHVDSVDMLISALSSVYTQPRLFTPEERAEIDQLKEYFTKSQGDALEDAFCYYRLKSPAKDLIWPRYPLPDSKRERSSVHEQLVAALTD